MESEIEKLRFENLQLLEQYRKLKSEMNSIEFENINLKEQNKNHEYMNSIHQHTKQSLIE